ncbi:hypothetical protein NDU88_001547 [Pleurodeles waltl]|uniref:Uncharacterized protein n=1 Tax=Pleurodeles waltl TaxID=8319 RepID=A0AAV7U6P2_PLEWA|nr:hypothetical protein NDU88_001547 [Pleurodeles waltl]
MEMCHNKTPPEPQLGLSELCAETAVRGDAQLGGELSMKDPGCLWLCQVWLGVNGQLVKMLKGDGSGWQAWSGPRATKVSRWRAYTAGVVD